MRILPVALVCAWATTGCAPKPTTLRLEIAAAAGVTVQTLTLTVRLPGSGDRTQALPPSPSLPGAAVVRLPDVAMDVAVALDGQDRAGAPLHADTVAHVEPHATTSASLTVGDVTPAPDMAGTGGIDMECVLPTCAYAQRRALTITNGAASPLPAGYSIRVPLDPADFPASDVRADLNDVRVFRDVGVEVPRAVDLAPPGQTRALWLALTAPIAAGASDSSYTLYYGDATATAPAFDPAQVFAFWDGFDATSVAAHWMVSGAPAEGGGTLTLHQNGSDGVTTTAASDGVPTLSAVEWRARITDPASAGQVTANGTFWYWAGYQHTGDFTPSDPWIVWISRGANEVHGERKIPGGTACSSGCSGPPVTADTAFHWYRIERDPTVTRFFYDGALSYMVSEANDTDYSLMLRDWAVTSDLVVDWMRARPLVAPEPTVALGAAQPNH